MTGFIRCVSLEATRNSVLALKKAFQEQMDQTNSDASPCPVEFSFTFPKIPYKRVHVHLTLLSAAIMVFLTTTNVNEGNATSALGSFVYAMPDVCTLLLFPLIVSLGLTRLEADRYVEYYLHEPILRAFQYRLCHPDGKTAGTKAEDSRLCGLQH